MPVEGCCCLLGLPCTQALVCCELKALWTDIIRPLVRASGGMHTYTWTQITNYKFTRWKRSVCGRGRRDERGIRKVHNRE